MNDIIIERRYTKDDEEKYFYLPFTVPSGVERMKIVLSHEGESILDLGLISPDGKQNGATGGRTQTIIISERFATPGYMAVVPESGEWKLILGVYRVKSEVRVTVKINLTFSQSRWLKGDTHVHTYNSDGKFSPAQILKKSERKGFDFCFITDHNNSRAHDNNLQSEKVNIIYGEELTLYAGHINLFGVKDPVSKPYCAVNNEELGELLAEARRNGAMVSINHPDCKNCGFRLDRGKVHPDCVEVWNGPMRIDNITTVKWWHEQLLKGNRLSAIGGSDFHHDYIITDLFGMPITAVRSASGNKADIIDAMRKGRCVVSVGVKGPMIYLNCGEAQIGDSIKFYPGMTITVKATGVKKGQVLRVYNNDTVILEKEAKGTADITVELPVKEKGFVRAEFVNDYSKLKKKLYRLVVKKIFPLDAGLEIPAFLSCITNPLYIE